MANSDRIAQPTALVTITKTAPGKEGPLIYQKTIAVQVGDNDDLLGVVLSALETSRLEHTLYES